MLMTFFVSTIQHSTKCSRRFFLLNIECFHLFEVIVMLIIDYKQDCIDYISTHTDDAKIAEYKVEYIG